MLEVRDLKKYYKTKGGVEVHALDGVSIQFPETGMVFLLGKSGSGKSTLLNVSGGLDKPDSGEIIVKGKSSKDFTQSDFDSYRNTFIGFVFQEYNILNEFNIETNIALALELQGKKNDKKAVEDLLKQVDLEGMGKRKPNTLSGGQKQRIAIARALIKNPEIIMADEPTGALDSNTGKQVLDTLKKLSETKLVIIVSHDRDFAEEYADRIIELKDGKVISDHSKDYAKAKEVSSNVRKIGEDTIQIKDVTKLSDDEIKEVIKSLKGKGEVIISNNENNVTTFKKVARINDDGAQQYFRDTDLKKVNIKSYDGAQTKFIKSKLPSRHALKMGTSNLRIKPGRLIITMFLSVIAFSMFGILSTLMFYNPAFSFSRGIADEAYESLVMEKYYHNHVKEYKIDKDGNEKLDDEDVNDVGTSISNADIKKLNNNNYGLEFAGVYLTEIDYSSLLGNNVGTQRAEDLPYYSCSKLYGLTDCGENFLLRQSGFSKLAGEYPSDPSEIAISDYVYELFNKRGYMLENKELDDKGNETIVQTNVTINNYSDLIGKKLKTNVYNSRTGSSKEVELTISGIYKTDNGLYSSKYEELKKAKESSQLSSSEYNALSSSFEDVFSSSFSGLGFVSEDFYDAYKTYLLPSSNQRNYINNNIYIYGYKLLDIDSYRNYKDPNNLDKSSYKATEYDQINGLTPKVVEGYKSYFHYFDNDGNVLSAIPKLEIGDVLVNLKSYNISNAIFSMCENGIGDLSARYDRNGDLSFYERFDKGSDNASVYMNYNTLDIGYDDKPGYEYANDFIVGDDGEVIAYVRNVYVNDSHTDYREEWQDGFYNMGQVWFDKDKNPISIAEGIRTVDLSYFYYDPIGKKPYIEDDVTYNSQSQPVLKSDNSVVLKYYNNGWYYVEKDGYPVDTNSNSTTIKKGLFVNKSTGELSFKKSEGSVFTDKYYIDTNNNIYIGTYVSGQAYRYYDDNSIAHYSFNNNFCDLGYVDMAWNYTKSVKYVEQLPNCNEILKATVKYCINVSKDTNRLENLKMNYPTINFESIVDEEFTKADVSLLINALKSYANDYPDQCSFNPGTTEMAIISDKGSITELKISGFFMVDTDAECYYDAIISDSWIPLSKNPYGSDYTRRVEITTKYNVDKSARYGAAICKTDKTTEQLTYLIQDYDDDSFYMLSNKIFEKIYFLTDELAELKTIFLIIGCVMAAFSGLMLLNFISTSISAKQKEIGILRAVGARGSDVFKIFFSESGIICLICFVLSSIAGFIACYFLNKEMSDGLELELFEFGLINIGVIFAVALMVGLIGTLFPVVRASKRPPVESIRAL